MSAPTRNFLVHGAPKPCVFPRKLSAGPLSLDYETGDIRAVRLGVREIIRRIYGAVRDRNWFTVPFEITGFEARIYPAGFHFSFNSEHRWREIDFTWRAEIRGDGEGRLRFSFDGQAHSTFLRNRIGLCVLHPILDCSGARCRAMYEDGSVGDLTFPTDVAAEQPINGFQNLVGLAHEVTPGLWVELRFSGDLFETEDQRNWIDASFKTFSTPLSLPRPVEVTAGTRIRQTVELRLRNSADSCFNTSEVFAGVQFGSLSDSHPSVVDLDLHPITPKVLFPKIGFKMADAPLISEIELRRLSALKCDHLRADLKLHENDWRVRLDHAAQLAQALSLPLELAIELARGGDFREAGELREAIARSRAGVTRILGNQAGCTSTTSSTLQQLRSALNNLGIPIGGGSDSDLYQLQLQPPPPESDFVFWSMNPQVHASDDRSIMETPEGAAHQVATMAQRYPSRPLVISPITLKPRFNPVAVGPEPWPLAGELPPVVDPRQMSLFCAAWAVAMLAALAPSGVASITFFKTSGWQGVMEDAQGTLLPEKFPSVPGGVYPVWHVFAALNGYEAVAALGHVYSGRLAAFLAFDRSNRQRLFLANLTPTCLPLRISPGNGMVRVLDEINVLDAMREPEQWWQSQGKKLQSSLELRPYAVGFLDLP